LKIPRPNKLPKQPKSPTASQGEREKTFLDPKNPRRRWYFTREMEQSRFLSSLILLTFGAEMSIMGFLLSMTKKGPKDF
jgi:hypothetical protein